MIYVASPYTDANEAIMEQRYDDVSHFVAHVVNAEPRLVLYSPIVHWHAIADVYGMPKDHEFWLNQDREMIRLASSVWVLKLPGWDRSKGIISELDYCAQIQKQVRTFFDVADALAAVANGSVDL